MIIPRFVPFSGPLSRTLPLLGLLWCGLQAGSAADIVLFPIPAIPAGVNSAVYPAPRDDWFVKFQGNLDRTRGQQYDLLFDGDSITDFWQTRGKEVWAQHYGDRKAIDFGISGDRTENLLWRLQQGQVDGLDPKLVVLMIGTNNIGRESNKQSIDQIAEGVKAVVAQYEERCPHAHILLLGVFPRSANAKDDLRTKVAALNGKISSPNDGARVTYLDIGQKFLQPDGTLTTDIMVDLLHPSPKGYAIWADAIQPVIDKYCPATVAH